MRCRSVESRDVMLDGLCWGESYVQVRERGGLAALHSVYGVIRYATVLQCLLFLIVLA